MRGTLVAARRRIVSDAEAKNLRYSPKTSSVVMIAEAARSAVMVKARWCALSKASAKATQ